MLSVSLLCQKISSWHVVSVVNEPKQQIWIGTQRTMQRPFLGPLKFDYRLLCIVPSCYASIFAIRVRGGFSGPSLKTMFCDEGVWGPALPVKTIVWDLTEGWGILFVIGSRLNNRDALVVGNLMKRFHLNELCLKVLIPLGSVITSSQDDGKCVCRWLSLSGRPLRYSMML